MTEDYAVGDITKLLKGEAADTKEIEDFFGSKQSEDIVERKPKDGITKKKREHKPKNDKRSQKRKREEAITEKESDNESEDEEDDKYKRSYDDIRTPHDVLDEDDDDEDERPGKRAKTSEREWQKDTEKMARTVFVGNFPIRNKTLKVCYLKTHSNQLASTKTVKTHFQTIWWCGNCSYALCSR